MAKTQSPESLPSPTYIVPSTQHELKMSYGMFNDILRFIGNPADASAMLIQDSNTRDLVIRRLFTDNKKSVEKFEELNDSFEIEILPSEVNGIIGWVADHCAYFLMSTGQTMTTVLEKYKDQLESQVEETQSLSLPKSGSSD